MTRLSDTEITTLLAEHVLRKRTDYCGRCSTELWPCPVYRMAEEIRDSRAVLGELGAGVDHPLGVQGAPHFYEALAWVQGIVDRHRFARLEEPHD